MPDHDDLASEQQYLCRLTDRLEELRTQTRTQLDDALLHGGGTPQARSERDSFVCLYTAELQAYNAANIGLYFGRLDMADGDIRHIGRVGLRDDDEDLTPLLLDWRADQSRPFYLATTARPEGAHRRRHLHTIGRTVVDVHDEYLTTPADGHLPEGNADVVGEAALLGALDAARTGHMTDIVATIQREQDEIIRNPHRGLLVVQGGPGTGKTAVALHRAAYLLYTYRRQLDRSGVLIVGPNARFLHYIARVLPSLGESGVVLRTLADLYPGVHAVGAESLRGQEVKGSEVMTGILRSAVRSWQSAPENSVAVRCEGIALEISPAMVRAARGRARMTRRPHNAAREVFARHLIDALTESYESALVEPVSSAEDAAWNPAGDGAGDLGDPHRPLLGSEDRVALRSEVEASADVTVLVEKWWPYLEPEKVLADLLSSRERIADAAGEYVEEDQDALFRVEGSLFSVSDVPLLDELAELLGPKPGTASDMADSERSWNQQVRQAEEALTILSGSASQDIEDDLDPEILMAYDILDAESLAERHRATANLSVADRAAADRTWTYGHVIVDEAQELSPMAWRMLMRRSPNRWMTIVGDAAQTSSPAGVDEWGESLAPFVDDRWVRCDLSVNYRTPATIAELSNHLLGEIDPDSTPPRPVRPGTHPIGWYEGSPPETLSIVSELVSNAPPARAVAVIYPDDLPPDQTSELTAEVCDARQDATVVPVSQSKGLEYDAVILFDPEAVIDRSPQGMQDLYVAITRATQQLSLVQPGAFGAFLATLRNSIHSDNKERIA